MVLQRFKSLPLIHRYNGLRHTFASWAAQRGMNLYTLQEIMGQCHC